jgi:hypothetical protein
MTACSFTFNLPLNFTHCLLHFNQIRCLGYVFIFSYILHSDYTLFIMKTLRSLAFSFCWSVSIVCCELPAFIVSTVAEKYKDLQEIRELKRPPRGTLRKKRRSLTPPPTKRSRLRGKRSSVWSDQSESLLLAALPYELRVMIWKYVVGGQYIHLGLLKCPSYHGRLAYILCQSTEPSDWSRCKTACFKKWHTYQPESNQRLSLSYNVKPWKPPLIELLQTCHQM